MLQRTAICHLGWHHRAGRSAQGVARTCQAGECRTWNREPCKRSLVPIRHIGKRTVVSSCAGPTASGAGVVCLTNWDEKLSPATTRHTHDRESKYKCAELQCSLNLPNAFHRETLKYIQTPRSNLLHDAWKRRLNVTSDIR